MELLFSENQKLNLNAPPLLPLKKQQHQKHDHVYIAFCQVQRISLKVTQTVLVILASLRK